VKRDRSSRKNRGWLVGAVLLVMGAAVWGQEQSRIAGTVRDETGAVLPGASVTVLNERTGAQLTVTSDDKGYFIVPQLQPSTYTVTVSMASFADLKYPRLEVVAGETRTLDVRLKVAGGSETIQVVTDADPVIDTSSARIGANVNQREVGNLPLNGRQLSQLYLQAPGSLNSGSGTFSDIRFSGRAVEQNVIRYDGVEGTAIIDSSPGNLNGEIPSPFRLQSSLENVQEFRVDSNSYPAEYGTGTGGQISVVSKSGSNRFHGSLFEYLRNDAVDARNFFDLSTKSPLRLNQFGGSLGGPIVQDKAFFFFSYEGYRLRSGINFVEAVPSAAAAARAVPAVTPLLPTFLGKGAQILPGASTNPDFDIAQLQGSTRVDENAVGLRLDYKAGARNQFYLRFYRDQGSNDQPEGVTGRHTLVRAVPQNGVLAWQTTVTPAVVNDFKFGYNSALTRVSGIAPQFPGIDLSAVTLNISGTVANTGISGQGASSGIAIPGGLVRQNSATNGRGAPYTPYSLSLIDSLSWIRRNHTLKFGGEIRRIRMYTDRLGGTTYTWSNLDDFLANRLQQVQYLGDVSAPSAFNNGATGERLAESEYYIGYAQDEWRLRPSLTLSYGLRYEYYTPLREDRDLNVQFDTERGVLLPSDRPFFTSIKTNFAPRIAVAWSPNYSGTGLFAGGRTVLRAGFGLNYGPGQVEDQIQPIESDRISSTISGGAYPIDPAAVTANFINNPNNRQYQPRAYSTHYRIPERIYQYSLSIQQELPYRMVLTAGYVGSQGRNLFLRNITNRIIDVRTNPNPASAAIVIRQFDIVNGDTIQRPYAEVDYKESGGTDRYNALQFGVTRRFETGVTMNAQYTFARSFGNTSGSNEALTAANPFDYEYDRGYNAFDVRHAYNLSALYALPVGRGKRHLSQLNSFGQAVLGDWEIGTILNGRSGLPIDLRVTRPDVVYVDAAGRVFSSPAAGLTAVINTPGGGASRAVRRPDLISGVDPFLGNDRAFLNPAAFAIPRPGTFGNLQRGLLHGPNFNQVDLTLAKRFPLREGMNLEFRSEVFNLSNHANFANPPATLPNALGTGNNQIQPGQPFTTAAAGNFGVLNRTVERTVGLGTNRQIQFALRLIF
jgi:hypothetical protein